MLEHSPISAPQSRTIRRVLYDRRLSPGAKLLWFYLNDRKNKNGQAWPSFRTIAKEIRCNTTSITGRISELYAAGYIKTERMGQHHHFRYTILGGDNKGWLPHWCNRSRVTQGSGAKFISCHSNGRTVTLTGMTRRVTQVSDESNNSGSKYNKTASACRLDAVSAADADRSEMPVEECERRWAEAKKSEGL
jgi:hypothetical protein